MGVWIACSKYLLCESEISSCDGSHRHRYDKARNNHVRKRRTKIIEIGLFVLIKKTMVNSVPYHVLGDEEPHIHKRTPNRPISFYDCNERTNFDLKQSIQWERTKKKERTGVNPLQNPMVARNANIRCTVYLFRWSGIERRKKNVPFPSNYLMRFKHLWEESQTIYFRLPQNIIKHFILVHLFRGFDANVVGCFHSEWTKKVVTFTGIVCHFVGVGVYRITWIRFDWKCPKHEQKAPRKIKPLTTIIKRVSRCIKRTRKCLCKGHMTTRNNDDDNNNRSSCTNTHKHKSSTLLLTTYVVI